MTTTIQEIIERAEAKGLWALTGNELETYREAWRSGMAEQWRATVSYTSLDRKRIIHSDVTGVSRSHCLASAHAMMENLMKSGRSCQLQREVRQVIVANLT